MGDTKKLYPLNVEVNSQLSYEISKFWFGYFSEGNDGNNPFFHISNILSNDISNVKIWSKFSKVTKTVQILKNGEIKFTDFSDLFDFLLMLESSFTNLKNYVSIDSQFLNMQILKLFLSIYNDEEIENIYDESNRINKLSELVYHITDNNNLNENDLDQLVFIAENVGFVISKPIRKILTNLEKCKN